MPKIAIPYKRRPLDHEHHNYNVATDRFVYTRAGNCSVCPSVDVPLIRFSKNPASPGICRMCLTQGIDTIENVGKSLGLNLTGSPPVDPPPILDVWICKRRTFNILGIAQGADFKPPRTIVLDSPFLFRPLEDPRVDVVLQMWESSWANRGLMGRHHVVRTKPHNLLKEDRYSVQLPPDYDLEELELQVIG